MRPRSLSLLAACLLSTIANAQQAAESAPDLVITNAKVFTSDPANRWTEAVAIRGNRIVAVGKSADIAATAGSATKRIDAGGRVVIPGLNDAHTHQVPMPEHLQISSDASTSAEDLKLAIRSGSDETPETLWMFGDIGPAVLADASVNAGSLDKLAPHRRIVLEEYTGHGFIFSRAALDALRIRDDAPDPAGGWWERDANGRITGKAFEYAGWNAKTKLSETTTDDEAAEQLRGYTADALRWGITSIQNMAHYGFSRYEKLVRHTPVPLRIRMIRFPGTDATGRDVREGRSIAANDRERPLSPVSGTKWILDGTPVEEGAALRRPYRADAPDHLGKLNFSAEEITKMLGESVASGDPLLLHVAGDRTAETVLGAMEAMKDVNWKAQRVRFEHADGLLPDLVPRAAALGIVAVQNPAHFAIPNLYPGNDYFPLASLVKAGIVVAIGSDGATNPFLNIMLATTHPRRPSEALTREQAVEAYTRGSAYAENAETEKGTIAAGKLADLAILSQDIFRVSNGALPDTYSVLTIVDGKVVQDAGTVAVVSDDDKRRRPRQ
jgi:predicted amidohydrolase YtcJ